MSVRSVTAYSLVNATVRALYSMLLGPGTWATLVHAQDFDAALNALSKTVYAPYLEIKREDLTPRRAVYQVRRRLADVYEKIIRLTSEPGRQLLLWLWRLYEVDNLKAALRGAETRTPWDRVLFLLYPRPKHAALTDADMQAMVESGSVARAVELTRHTPYYNTLSHALERYQAEENLFPLEVALDLEHNRGLWQSIDHLTGLDYEHAMNIVGGMLDMDNLLWAIRYRVYHHLSEQEIINYTLPFGYQVHDEDIRAIAAGEDIAQVVARIYPDVEMPEQLGEQDDAGLKVLELALQRRIIGLCRAAFSGYPFHVGIPLAYLVLSEYEIRDLTVLVEAKASHVPPEAFAPMLMVQPTA